MTFSPGQCQKAPPFSRSSDSRCPKHGVPTCNLPTPSTRRGSRRTSRFLRVFRWPCGLHSDGGNRKKASTAACCRRPRHRRRGYRPLPAPVHNPAAVERIPFYVKSLSRCNISRNNSSSSSSSAFSRYPSSYRMQVFQEPGVPWVPLAPLGDSEPSHGEPGPPSRRPLHAAEAVPCEAFAQPGLARAGKARLDARQSPCARSAPGAHPRCNGSVLLMVPIAVPSPINFTQMLFEVSR